MPRVERHEEGTELLPRGESAPLACLVRDASGTPAARSFRLTAGTCIVGAGSDADLTITHPTVSRRHASFELVPEGVRVTDLGSRNGTFYMGQRVERITLGLGARISLGGALVALDADSASLHAAATDDLCEYRGMLGVSPSMRRLFTVMRRLEGSLATVLVHGESGVGKELVAAAIHQGSKVAAGPYVTVNCGALPRELVASELFGHRKGAFTGATETREGAFSKANGGTLFLDEVGELPLEIQPTLLRALEVGEIQPVGGQPVRVQTRIVAATHRNLEDDAGAGRFREDLFYRLAVVVLDVPPLRERVEDVEPLARRFAHAAGVDDVPADVMEELRHRAYRGNARELRNVVQSWAALGHLPRKMGGAGGDDLRRILAAAADPDRAYAEQKEAIVDLFTRAYLEKVLAKTGGSQIAAAKIAGLDRSYLGRLVARFDLGQRK